jgi:hypothetical protein
MMESNRQKNRPPSRRSSLLLTFLVLALAFTNISAAKLGGKTVDNEVSTETKKLSLVQKLFPITSTLFKR